MDENMFYDNSNIGVYVKQRIITDKMRALEQLQAVTESIDFGISGRTCIGEKTDAN
jgi:hypothetical protein